MENKQTSRRKFLASAPLAVMAVASCKKSEQGASDNRQKIKFSLFSDLHYRHGDYNWASKRLDAILKRAEENNVDFVMECGDFCHNVIKAKPVIDKYNNFKIPTYHAIGNHDFEETKTLEIVVKAMKMKNNFYTEDKGVFKIIALDTNYFINKKGEVEHYASSSAYDKCHQKMAIITKPQLDMLAEALRTAKGPCLIFSHNGMRPSEPAKGITNHEEVKKVISENQRTPIMWINGHYHRNNLRLENGIAYFVINSPTSDWLGGNHNGYPPEIMNSSPLAKRELLYDKPVNAVVTVWEDGEVKIEGMKGKPFMDKYPEDLGSSSYLGKLPFDASVLSSHFKIFLPVEES